MKTESLPFFYIITTTHNRPELLRRNILSVQNQTYQSFLHFIINDSEQTSTYNNLRELFSKKNIHYSENTKNIGKNKTLNNALLFIKQQNSVAESFVVYLDDDDWLHKDALMNFVEAIQTHNTPWIISNRSMENGKTLTENRTKKSFLSYKKDYLLLKKFRGDATHCISADIATRALYSDAKKNGEEWIYFSQIDTISKRFFYINREGTLTEGYSDSGITKNYKHPSLAELMTQAYKYKIISPSVILYIILRKIKHSANLIRNFK